MHCQFESFIAIIDQCLQIELVLTAATFSVAIIGSIAGIFGMNLSNKQEDSYTIFLVVG